MATCVVATVRLCTSHITFPTILVIPCEASIIVSYIYKAYNNKLHRSIIYTYVVLHMTFHEHADGSYIQLIIIMHIAIPMRFGVSSVTLIYRGQVASHSYIASYVVGLQLQFKAGNGLYCISSVVLISRDIRLLWKMHMTE